MSTATGTLVPREEKRPKNHSNGHKATFLDRLLGRPVSNGARHPTPSPELNTVSDPLPPAPPAEPPPACAPLLVAEPKGFTPITRFEPEDVFIAGYPKSGNTWFQDLLSAVVYGVLPEYAPAKLPNELVPDLHFNEFYMRYQTPMYFKTHALPQPEYKRVVYLLRDGRDVMVSYFHYNAALARQRGDFMRMVADGEGVFPCKWHEHVQAWLANPYRSEMMVIRFEDLKKDTARELARFCEFSGVRRDSAFLEQMAAAATFEKMQAKEARQRDYVEPRWPKDTLFRRRGQVGSYQDEMPAEILQAFLAQAGPALEQCGYLEAGAAKPTLV